MITLIGASGSGKSTLLRCINLLEPIDDGTIMFDGVDIAEPGIDADPIRRRIGMIFQSYNLFPHMNVTDNVAIGPRKVLGTDKATARRDAVAMLTRLGLAERADAYPDQLSGGQQQRVAIARSLAMQPDVMLLDEITSALDPELIGEVLDVVRDLKARRDDDGVRHARDGLRPRDQRPGVLPAPGSDPGGGSAGADLRCAGRTAHPRVPPARHRRRPPLTGFPILTHDRGSTPSPG